MKAAILGHLFRNNLLTPSQHGFLPQRSCTTYLLIFMDSLTQAEEDGLITDAVFFDFAKAFDEVPHSLLLFKLHAYGIRGNLLSWISNFLRGPTFRVGIGSTLSSPATVSSGVPQGSVPRPSTIPYLCQRPPRKSSPTVPCYMLMTSRSGARVIRTPFKWTLMPYFNGLRYGSSP